jgi:aryl-alcohol dehydrogenase-like predicted oxidoreductase
MRYMRMGRSELQISIVSQGTWQMGADEWGQIDDDQAVDAIRKSIDCGVNLVDTAPRYGVGHAEELVGRAIKGKRNGIYVSTKCGLFVWRAHDGTLKTGKDLSAKAIREEIEVSLKRIGTTYIDLYFIHWPDPVTPIEESMGELERLRKEGKLRYLGVSNFDVELLRRAMKTATIDCIQTQFSILSRQNAELITFAHENGIGVMTYGSIGAGILTGRTTKLPVFKGKDARDFFYPFFKEPMFGKCMEFVDHLRHVAAKHDKPVGQVAINWAAQHEGVTSALVGSVSPKHVEENVGAGDWELTAEDLGQMEVEYNRIFKPDDN